MTVLLVQGAGARRTWLRSIALALGLSAFAPASFALSEQDALANAEHAVTSVNAELTKVLTAAGAAGMTPEERLAAAELVLGQKNYARASEIAGQLIELYHQRKTSPSVHANALFLLAESCFRNDQLSAARRHYREIVRLASEEAYGTYAGRALARLVDVGLRTQRPDELERVLQDLDRVAARIPHDIAAYARAKALIGLRRGAEAERWLERVLESSQRYLQAQYLLGVVYQQQALHDPEAVADPKAAEQVPASSQRFARAILQFQRVTQLEPRTNDQRHVVDLAWMALGRLFYETGAELDAADAYSRVNKNSPEFATMLFELSWVYIRLEDFERAERGLEVLSVVSPDRLGLAEGMLLRADLMLRSKQFPEALSAYRSVRNRFEPVQQQVDAIAQQTTGPSAYYDRLVEDRSGVRTRDSLPPMVMGWLREEAEDDNVFSLIDDVNWSRETIETTRRAIGQANAILESPVRARAFPEPNSKLQGVTRLINQLTLARRDLALGLDTAASSSLHGELQRVQAARHLLMERLVWLPTSPRDIAQREASGLRRWNQASQKVQRLQLDVDRLQAVVNGLKRVLRDSDRFGAALGAAQLQGISAELDSAEQQIAQYEQRIRHYRESIDNGRLQVGFGDFHYQKDDELRLQFEGLFRREMELALAGYAGEKGVEYARSIAPLLARIDALQGQLESLRQGLEAEIAARSNELESMIREEEAKLRLHGQALTALNDEARQLVGEVAMRSFTRVQERLSSVVLRADVGIAQQAWEMREGRLERVQKLQRERSREERLLEEEQREVSFDGSSVQP